MPEAMIKDQVAISEISKLNVSIAEVKKDVGYIKSDLSEVKTDVRSLSSNVLPRVEYEGFKKAVYDELTVKVSKSEFDIYMKAFWIVFTAAAATISAAGA